MSFDVWAQADVVFARLTIEPASTAGWLETTLLEAIGAGVVSPTDLADVLGLAPSLVLNALGDLWRAGRISFEDADAEHETLTLTSSGLASITDHNVPVETTAQTTTTEELVVERLTGRVLPAQFARRRPAAQEMHLVVPVLLTDVDAVTNNDLQDALAAAIDMNRAGLGDKYRDKRVRTASLQPTLLQNRPQRRYVRIAATAHRSDIDELTISVVDEHLTLRERELATKHLQEVLDSTPRSNFANQVRQNASQVPLKSHGIDRAVQELRNSIESMPACHVVDRQQRHDHAEHLAGQIVTYAETLAEQEMQIRLVTSQTEHRAALDELLQTSIYQVVIAVPWIRVKGLEAIRESLLGALDRGVQVILIWGIDGHDNGGLDTAEATWLDSISAHVARSGGRGKLLYSRDRAARSHAKIAIADDRRMLVSSMNFLSNSNHTEVGIVLTAFAEHQSPAISAALRYAYDKAPNPQIAFSLNHLPGAFGSRTSHHVLNVPIPRFTKALGDEQAPDGTVRAWAAAWADCAGELTKLLNRPNPTVDLIADLQHRGVLRNTLTEATDRALVTSDKLSDTALNEDIVALARSRSHEGLKLRFHYRSTTGEGQARVDALVCPGNEEQAPVDIDRSAAMHAKIVLRDDRVLLGSFNPLSVDADLRQRRSTGELGVDIRSAHLADAIWLAITGEHTVPNGSDVVLEQGSAGVDSGLASIAQELIEALEEPTGDRTVAVIRKHGFDRVFRSCTEFAIDASGMTRVPAAGLIVDLEQEQPTSTSASALLRQQLRAGNWGVVHLLREHTDAVDIPSQRFSQSLDDGYTSGESLLFGDIADTDLSPSEYEALTVVDCVALLLGEVQAADSDAFFHAARKHSTSEARDFVESAVAYLHRYSTLPERPPAVLTDADRRAAPTWSGAIEAVAGLSHYDPKLQSGWVLHNHIFGPNGEMTVLRDALDRKDTDSVTAWYATYVRDGKDDKWLDRAARAANLKDRITDSRRSSFVQLRGKVRKAVRLLCDELDAATKDNQLVFDEDQAASLEQLVEAGRALHAVRAESDTLVEVVVANELNRLLRWAACQPTPTPARDWRGGTFVATWIAVARNQTIQSRDLLHAVSRDLCTVRTLPEAVLELARADQFAHASALVDDLEVRRSIDSHEAVDLRNELSRLRTGAIREVTDAIDAVMLSNEHAGVDPGPVPTIENDDVDLGRVREALARYKASSDHACDDAKGVVENQLAEKEDGLTPSWRGYVTDLIESNELVLAQQALQQRIGDLTLPRPQPFARWSWANEDVGVVARWFFSEYDEAPYGMRNRFMPKPDDVQGGVLTAALQSLIGPDSDFGVWVGAVHQLVNDHDEFDAPPQVTEAGGHTYASMRLPYSDKLPRLRWADGEPVKIAVGDSPLPDTLFRLSPNLSRDVTNDTVIDVADILSLLSLRDGTGTPTQIDRTLQFLSTLCSRLPLEAVIDPADTPSRMTETGRRQLAWLLSIIGVQANARDVDRLRIWAGGHETVLWSLINHARNDQTRGIPRLSEHQASRNEVLLQGLETEIGRDEDQLMLAIGLLGALEGGVTAFGLMSAFEEEYQRAERLPHGLRLSDVVERLVASGYVIEESGLLRSCGCGASQALADAANDDWINAKMDGVDPTSFVNTRAFDFILGRIRHQERQSTGKTLDDDAMKEKATTVLSERMNDETEFDLVTLCEGVYGNYAKHDWDVLFDSPDGSLHVDTVGPRIWIELLMTELLNNAAEALRGMAPGDGTIWMSLDVDTELDSVVVRIRNNGRRIPAEIADAFAEGRILRRPGRTDRGTGLVGFKRFGEARGVRLSLHETPAGHTLVECTMPLAQNNSISPVQP